MRRLPFGLELEDEVDELWLQLAQLADVHLEAHAHGDGRTRGQLVERIPHGIEIEVRVAAMRRAYDLGDAGLVRGMDHAHALAEAACPVVNTGIFCIGMYFGFGSALQSSEVFGAAASAGLVSFILIGLAGVNFLYEVLSNVVVCPIVAKALYSSKFFKDAK